MARKITCYVVVYKGHLYRPFGKVLSIHAASYKHAMRLLKAAKCKGFRYFLGLSVQENKRGNVMDGSCYFHLIAKPPYDNTPFGFKKKDVPEWKLGLKTINPKRQAIIDQMVESRPDLYE